MKKLNVSSFLLDRKDRMHEIVSSLGKTFPYVSILGNDVYGKNYRYSTASVVTGPANDEEKGFVIRVFQKDCGFSEYSFNDLTDDIVEEVEKLAIGDRKIFLKNNEPMAYAQVPEDLPAKECFVGSAGNLPEDDKTEEIIGKMGKLHDKFKEAHPKIVQLVLSMEVDQVNKLFISKNRELYQSYIYTTGMVMAMAKEGDKIQYDYNDVSGMVGSEIIDSLDDLMEKTCSGAEELLKADKVEPGTYDIICDPTFTGLIAHEAFGHGTEMDMFVKNRAKGADYLGKRVGSDKLTMHDGAKSFEQVSSYLFDDEGNFGKDTTIIKKGIFTNGMCDELSALVLGIEPTGNGKRESYKRKAYTRMTNTFFEGGNDKLEDMIKSIDKGYLLEGMHSGMEDPKNWGIQCVALKGREIIDGKLTGKIVSPVYMTGYVPDLLGSISMVSPDLELSGSGYCGKGWKEWVRVSTGGSYIKARGVLS